MMKRSCSHQLKFLIFIIIIYFELNVISSSLLERRRLEYFNLIPKTSSFLNT